MPGAISVLNFDKSSLLVVVSQADIYEDATMKAPKVIANLKKVSLNIKNKGLERINYSF